MDSRMYILGITLFPYAMRWQFLVKELIFVEITLVLVETR